MTAARPRVVVLDDDEIFATLISEALGPDCDVAVGRNGLEGISHCLESRADLIVTDIGMPELDGAQMLEALSKDRRLADIPVLIVTATHFSRQNREDLARYPQVLDIINKATPLDDIAAGIRKALKLPQGPGQP